ncbi:MAG: MFS transporter, partial [Clostridiales bacterium]|nr:MFS transporter [Clostridiales bacterium]
SVLYSFMVTKLDYYDVMTMFFIMSAVMLVLSSAACFSYKKVINTPVAEKKKGLELSAFKNKTTIFLAIPSFLRGLASGIIALITVVGLSGGILNTETATYVSILTQITTFGGNMLYAVVCRKVKNRVTLMFACALIGIALPLSVVGGDLVTFLIGFAFTNFAYVIVNISIPILACEIVPYEQIGSFTCIRMMMFTLGSVISSIVYKPLSDSIGFFWLFIVAGVIQILCGVLHFIVSKKTKRVDQNTIEETNETKTEEE